MRYGRVLDRRLARLETVFVIPSEKDRIDALQVEALVSMSSEDLDCLHEIVLLHNAGSTVEETPERLAVAARWKEALATVYAKHGSIPT